MVCAFWRDLSRKEEIGPFLAHPYRRLAENTQSNTRSRCLENVCHRRRGGWKHDTAQNQSKLHPPSLTLNRSRERRLRNVGVGRKHGAVFYVGQSGINNVSSAAASAYAPRRQSCDCFAPMQIVDNHQFQDRDSVQIDHILFDFGR